MSRKRKTTCGDHGGRTVTGKPCRNRSLRGRCPHHAGTRRASKPRSPQFHAQKRAFLAAVAETGILTAAARASGVDKRRHYDWLRNDPEYRDEFEEAMETAADLLEQEARRRAVEGVPEPVFYKGKPVGAVRKYSDTLLIFTLKGVRPEKFRDRHEFKGDVKLSWAEIVARLDEDDDE